MKIKTAKEIMQATIPNNEPPVRNVADIRHTANPLLGHPSTPDREMQHLLPGTPGSPHYHPHAAHYSPHQGMPHTPFYLPLNAIQPQLPHAEMYPTNAPWPKYGLGPTGPVTPAQESPSHLSHTRSKDPCTGHHPHFLIAISMNFVLHMTLTMRLPVKRAWRHLVFTSEMIWNLSQQMNGRMLGSKSLLVFVH